MIPLAVDKFLFDKCIDTKYEPEKSIVLRYLNGFKFGATPREDLRLKEWMKKTSIQEGARIFHLMTYKDVSIYILDETTLMYTNTLKSVDGCITAAHCKLRGYDRVVFESGGNTGTAFIVYGQKVGLETFLFLPKDNIPLLDSGLFKGHSAHLISIEEADLVKKSARLFGSINGIEHIPEVVWRYQASMFRGFFISEYMLQENKFDWITQTISAAFGPIGIYRVLRQYRRELGAPPRFLGIQQEANCPIYRAWKSNGAITEPSKISSTAELLTRVMYDGQPQTYGSYEELMNVLSDNSGDLTTVNHPEFASLLEHDFDRKDILRLLNDNSIEITIRDGEIVEKTGLIALAGTIKQIDIGKIARGSRVLCCLTSGINEADGRAEPEYVIKGLDSTIKEYSKTIKYP